MNPLSPLGDISNRIVSHLVEILRATPVDATPFSHVHIECAFPRDIYSAMLDHLPALEAYRPDNPRKHQRVHKRPGFGHGAVTLFEGLSHVSSSRFTMGLDSERIAKLPDAERRLWSGVADALGSRELQNAVLDLFVGDLCRRFRTNRAGLNRIPMFPRPGLVRDMSGHWIAPHPDTRAKILTMQFYLARDMTELDLGTALYRRHLFDPRILISPKRLFEKVKQFEFRPNNGYAFPVGRRSWHGRDEVPATASARNSILLFYYREASKGF